MYANSLKELFFIATPMKKTYLAVHSSKGWFFVNLLTKVMGLAKIPAVLNFSGLSQNQAQAPCPEVPKYNQYALN